MTTKQKYDKVFMDSLSLKESELTPDLSYNKVDSWDSLGHMALVTGLEEAFGVTLETDDVINLSSYLTGQDVLRKYGVNFQA